MKKFGIKVCKNITKQPDLKLEEVTSKAYEQINIQVLMDNIGILESRIADELTLDNVSTLMNLYQKVCIYIILIIRKYNFIRLLNISQH